MKRRVTGFFFLFILFSSVKAQDPIKTLPQKAAVAYKSILSKLGLTVNNQSNAFWVKEEISSDITEYDISFNNATSIPFKAIFVVRYFQDKSGEDQIEVQLRFKMQDLKNSSFKPFSEIKFKNALNKCFPTNYANDDMTTLKISYDFKDAVLSNQTYKIAYYLISQKNHIDEDCEKGSLDSDEIEELIELRNKL